jgi:hypothetical protein
MRPEANQDALFERPMRASAQAQSELRRGPARHFRF